MTSALLIKLLFLAGGMIFCAILYNAQSKETETPASSKKYRDQARKNIKSHLRKLAAKAKANEKD